MNNKNSSLNKKKYSRLSVLRNNARMMKIVFRYAPMLPIVIFIVKSVTAVRAVINVVYFRKYFLDAFQMHKTIQEVVGFIIFFIVINLFDSLIGTIYQNVYFPKKKLVISKKMQGELFVKAKEIELAGYDNPEFYNDFIWSTEQADQQAVNVLENFGEFVQILTHIGSLGAIILSSDILAIFVVALSLLVSFTAQMKINNLDYKLSLQQKPIQRERDYTSRVLYLSDYAKEVRLSNVSNVLINNFKRVNQKLMSVIRSFGRKSMLWSFLESQVAKTLLIDGLYLLYLCYQTVVREVFSYGTFIALYNGVFNLRNSLQTMSKIVSRLQKNSLYIERLMKFIQYEPKITDCDNPQSMPNRQAVLELKNVSFKYDSNETETLNNINLTIKPGEKIALVGYNGAGKSTLIKLLMRLYDTSEGEVLLNGINIRNFSVEEYRNYFGVVFQDFQIFAGKISENVIMDEVEAEDEPLIKDALAKSGFSDKLDSLAKGINTMLTREFASDGTNLSGGEAQKIAISRVFPRDCQMVILDEPSSALDPISEYNVNQSMLTAAENKTVVFISHRLSTTRIADRILMLEHGRIIEQGSHKELMQLNGKYAQMFNMQAEKYNGSY